MIEVKCRIHSHPIQCRGNVNIGWRITLDVDHVMQRLPSGCSAIVFRRKRNFLGCSIAVPIKNTSKTFKMLNITLCYPRGFEHNFL